MYRAETYDLPRGGGSAARLLQIVTVGHLYAVAIDWHFYVWYVICVLKKNGIQL